MEVRRRVDLAKWVLQTSLKFTTGLNISTIRVFGQIRDPEIPTTLLSKVYKREDEYVCVSFNVEPNQLKFKIWNPLTNTPRFFSFSPTLKLMGLHKKKFKNLIFIRMALTILIKFINIQNSNVYTSFCA